MEAISALEVQIQQLQSELDARNAACADLESHVGELRKQLSKGDVAFCEQRGQLRELRQLYNARQVEYDAKVCVSRKCIVLNLTAFISAYRKKSFASSSTSWQTSTANAKRFA